MYRVLSAIILITGCGAFACSSHVTTSPEIKVVSEDPANSAAFGTPNEAPTLKPIVLAYHSALQRKDEAALKKVLSTHYIQTIETAIKRSGSKTKFIDVLAFGSGAEIPLDQIEVRNEVFDRNDFVDNGKAVAQVRKGPTASWEWVPFSRGVDGWKLTDEPFSLIGFGGTRSNRQE